MDTQTVDEIRASFITKLEDNLTDDELARKYPTISPPLVRLRNGSNTLVKFIQELLPAADASVRILSLIEFFIEQKGNMPELLWHMRHIPKTLARGINNGDFAARAAAAHAAGEDLPKCDFVAAVSLFGAYYMPPAALLYKSARQEWIGECVKYCGKVIDCVDGDEAARDIISFLAAITTEGELIGDVKNTIIRAWLDSIRT